jgi:hypothetical protein
MGDLFQSRRLLALLAAYVIALQAVLLPLSIAAAGPFASSPCTAVSSADGSPPADSHDNGCPCAGGCGMQCCSHVFVAPQPIAFAVVQVFARTPIPAPALEPIRRLSERRPQIPRGPPAA